MRRNDLEHAAEYSVVKNQRPLATGHDAWRRHVRGALPSAELRSGAYLPGTRVADVVCKTCGERMGALYAMPEDGVWLQRWTPPDTLGAIEFLSAQEGPVREIAGPVEFHCFGRGCGHRFVTRAQFDSAIAKFHATHKRQRVVASITGAAAKRY
jgi:hypothetical protein